MPSYWEIPLNLTAETSINRGKRFPAAAPISTNMPPDWNLYLHLLGLALIRNDGRIIKELDMQKALIYGQRTALVFSGP